MSNETTNPHAALIEQYCQDWKETPEPWTRWEFDAGGGWKSFGNHPKWVDGTEYRRKPDTIKVNGIECNAPLKVAPKVGTVYWTVSADRGVIRSIWDGEEIDKNLLKNGCVCATEEDAEALWNAMTAPLRAYVGGGK